MVDYHEINIKNVCCTCLNTERNLSQLCKVDDGVNDLFFLLSYKSEAYEAIFIKDMTQLYICWECIALLQRFTKFREQVCIAHSKLTDIIDGKVKYSNIKTLSKLSIGSQIGYDHVFGTNEEEPKMFLDCGPADIDIKYESDTDDEPLVHLRDLKTENLETKVKSEIDNDNSTIGFGNALNSEIGETMMEQKDIKKEVKNKNVQLKVNIPISKSYDKDMSKRKKNDGKNKGYVSNKAHIKVNKKVCINLIQMNKAERVRSIEEKKSKLDYVNAMNKCEECIEIFENCDSLEKHIAELHEPKPNTKMCNICKVYVKLESLNLHMKMHYLEWKCQICKESLLYKFKCKENVKNHLKTKHYMQDAYIDAQMKILTVSLF
nr:uncharacterized protein LOC117994965 [Maniola hyperantus]